MRFIWGLAALVFVIATCFVAVVLQISVVDLLFAQLSGSIAGAAFCVLAIVRESYVSAATKLLFFSIFGSTIAWLVALIALKITMISLIGSAALAFDLLIGAVGAATVIGSFFDMKKR